MASGKNVALIIVDQLRYDYLDYMPQVGALLNYHAKCSTGSIPASTEAMHANISTGTFPGKHGFISKTPKNKDNHVTGLHLLRELYKTKTIIPIGHHAFAMDYDVLNIGAKSETVLTMCLEEIAALQIRVDDKTHKLTAYVNDTSYDCMTDYIRSKNYQDLERGQFSVPLIDLATHALSKASAPVFMTLALPDLDTIGHEYGPGSDPALRHISEIDAEISTRMGSILTDSAVILLGDHGCRSTNRYFIETKDPIRAAVYHRTNNSYTFKGYFQFDRKTMSQVGYDGGILRVWFKEADSSFTQDQLVEIGMYGTPIDTRLPGRLRQEVARSLHPNLGELVVVAHKDATFCKRTWLDDDVQDSLGAPVLSLESLPRGEHGTYHEQDTTVPLLSNVPLLKTSFNNTEVSELIRAQFF